MQTLTPAMLTALGLTITRPGYLIKLGYSPDLYLSTMGTVSWNSFTWTAANIKVTGLSQDGSGQSKGGLELGNSDGAYGALVLTSGATDIPVSIWTCYAGATASGDPVQVFKGVTNGGEVTTAKVVLELTSDGDLTLYTPRVFINKAAGFNFLQAAGRKVFINGEAFILSRTA